ncbi:MAG TPA: hypothetical protein VHB21_19520, partial [Minicystis sp.]|nr:hypothetical protein [Minicystis sp.]
MQPPNVVRAHAEGGFVFAICVGFRRGRLVVAAHVPTLFDAMKQLARMRRERADGGAGLYVEARATGERYSALDARTFQALAKELGARGVELRELSAGALDHAERARAAVRIAASR